MTIAGESVSEGLRPADDGAQLVTLTVNGIARSVSSRASLLRALRDELGLTGAKPGCGEGACGACTVLADGEPVRACQRSAGSVADRAITTIEGLASGGQLHPVQQAFAEVGAAQCGYCTPGMILSAAALLGRDPNPDDGAVDAAMAGNLCRCGCYPRIRRAVHHAADLVQGLARQPAGSSGTGSGWRSAAPSADRWGPPEPGSLAYRPARPWDLTEPADRDWFGVLGDGLVVVCAPPGAAEAWTTSGGAWLHIGTGGTVTAFTGKVDVGQDNRTALRLLVAEELAVPLTKVRLAMGDTDLCPHDLGTFGSRSIPDAGAALRRAAAHARTAAPAAAGSRRIEIATGDPALTSPTRWQIAGRPQVPPGTLEAVTGARRFVSDLALSGMWHGAVLRPPAPGATLRELHAEAVDGRTDVLLVRTPVLTGIVAADPATARLGLADLLADWNVPDAPSDHDLEKFLRTHPAGQVTGRGGAYRHEEGDPDAAVATAAGCGAATYTTAYIAPAPLETRAAVAIWDDDGRLTVWTGTQTPFPVRAQVAAALGLTEDQVRIIVPPTGGGFGGKHAAGVAIEAAVLARQAGRPVRVAWNRHEEFTAATLRPAAVIDVTAGVTADGDLAGWTFANINSGQAAIGTPYRVPHLRLHYQPADSPLPQASYRALAATANNFARESQLDELAHQLGLDPVEFRLRNLDDERLIAVLLAAAERAGWDSREAGGGWGIACGAEKGGRVATAARVRAGSDGQPRVVRLITAYECGAVVNPEAVISQIEGAAVMALGGALFEAIRFAGGVITNGAFSAYRVPRLTDVPPIEVVLLDRPDLPSAGAGETPMIAVAPAIANAIFSATGRRLRSLPLLAEPPA